MNRFANLKYYDPKNANIENPVLIECDMCIYGSSSAGVSAAIQAKRMGLDVVLLSFGGKVGGLTSSGLGATDIGNKKAIGGIAREFYKSLGKYYSSKEPDGTQWTFEPHVAENIFNEWLDRENIPVYYYQNLQEIKSKRNKIEKIIMENGNAFVADIYIDATYEGDLMAQAGVSYHVGRESNATYKETLNGIHFGSPNHNFKTWIDPYVIEGNPRSGLVPEVIQEELGYQGMGDSRIQAYNFRICLTDDPVNKIPFPEPPNYNPEQFTLLLRYIRSGVWDAMNLHIRMPNGKTDLNNFGGFSTDYIGKNYEWPEGSYETREKIFQDHFNYNLGMLYFLSNDERVPKHIREEVNQWGLPQDEFINTGGWPHELYIREARRMISSVVMTEHHCRGLKSSEDSVGLAAYTMDAHNARRIIIDGRCVNEGNVEVPPTKPYPISYRAIVPKPEECGNLLVPVCLSASHIAFGSIRMEPVFMVLGQSAATAGALAIEKDKSVQEVDYKQLKRKLLEDKQILEWDPN